MEEGNEGSLSFQWARSFPFILGLLVDPSYRWGIRLRGEAQGHVMSELQRGDLNSALTNSQGPPRSPTTTAS